MYIFCITSRRLIKNRKTNKRRAYSVAQLGRHYSVYLTNPFREVNFFFLDVNIIALSSLIQIILINIMSQRSLKLFHKKGWTCGNELRNII